MSPEDRLREADIDLSRTFNQPRGSYVNAVTTAGFVYVSGHGPLLDGKPAYLGRVPDEVSEEDAYQAARLTMCNCLSTLQAHLGSLDRIQRFVKLLGMVRAEPGFTGHPGVIDGASDLLLEVFGERGHHTRSAVGMASLPFGIPVEIELVTVTSPGVGRCGAPAPPITET
jgi:enamine deaminase RidA (YjgF/YER057c/UK114 family)